MTPRDAETSISARNGPALGRVIHSAHRSEPSPINPRQYKSRPQAVSFARKRASSQSGSGSVHWSDEKSARRVLVPTFPDRSHRAFGSSPRFCIDRARGALTYCEPPNSPFLFLHPLSPSLPSHFSSCVAPRLPQHQPEEGTRIFL